MGGWGPEIRSHPEAQQAGTIKKKPVHSRPVPILKCSGVSNPVELASTSVWQEGPWLSILDTVSKVVDGNTSGM